MTKLQAVAPLFAKRARRALSAFDFKGRKLEQLTEIAEKGYIERNGAYYTISTGGITSVANADCNASAFILK